MVLRVRTPLVAWMFVLYVLYSERQNAKVRTIDKKKQVRIKCKEKKEKQIRAAGRNFFFFSLSQTAVGFCSVGTVLFFLGKGPGT
jgi:hypothetical protein